MFKHKVAFLNKVYTSDGIGLPLVSLTPPLDPELLVSRMCYD